MYAYKNLTKNEIKQLYKPWITLGIGNSIKRGEALYKKFIKAKNKDVKQDYPIRYMELRNNIIILCRASEKLYYQNFFANNSKNLKIHGKVLKL